MSLNSSKKHFAIGICAVGLGFLAGCDRLPYGLEHRKINETTWLASEISAWRNRGAKDDELTAMQFTNRSGICLYRYQTNLLVNGIAYQTILKMEVGAFGGRGSLVAARDASVIWVGSDGKCEITYHAKR